MTIKDFKVGDEVVYLDFNGYSTPKRTTLCKRYIINVGRKIITIGKQPDSFYGFKFTIDDSNMYLCSKDNYDLAFKDLEQYGHYVEYNELKHWAYRFDFDRLPYDKLSLIYDIATQEEKKNV